MYSFNNDYSEIATKEILHRLTQEAECQFTGYGYDEPTASARNKIKEVIGCPDCDVYFLAGGTQTNLVSISAMLKPYEAVIACTSGHINVHETGAIEGTGHKVETVPAINGKVVAEEVEKLVLARPDEHMVKPKAVYISNSTEIGTVYHLDELQALRAVCDKYGLYFYMDGARLGAAMMSKENDVTMKDLPKVCDMFYIGATKNGGMLGEALVVVNPELRKDFKYLIKNKGALLAKGFVNGIQFDVLFTDDLYFKLADHADQLAQKLAAGLKELGVKFFAESTTNQVFPIFSNEVINQMREKYIFGDWDAGEKESAVRLVCSWATPESQVDAFLADLKKVL